uniref:CCHC-type domain-containing protein n=1 Tax=Nothobranchius furzeri TaxID=105023 RepID=A0A8C6VZ34_NOTFU
MDIFETLAIKIPNAVLIDGLPEQPVDEVIDFLEQYGNINRKVTIDASESEFDKMLVIEFTAGSSLVQLSQILPYTFVSDEGDTFRIESLSDIYSSAVGGSKTNAYLADLQKVAKLSGRNYAEVLNEVMSQISQSIAELKPETLLSAKKEESADSKPSKSVIPPSLPDFPPKLSPVSSGVGAQGGFSNDIGDLNPPGVQRYVVEHVVRSGDHSLHASHRLRTFSGKVPRPVHETDYDTWRSAVELALNDPSMSDLQRTRLICDSLLPPASDMVKHLSLDTLPNGYMKQLDSAYGTVQDGEELYAKFLDTFQDSGEKPSAYLQRLQVALQCAAKRGGVSKDDMDKRLLNQFCRGCWDNNLIAELQLKQRKDVPPKFAEFLLLLRTEEDREAAKTLRMKQHLGTVRQKVTAQAQFVNTGEDTNLCSALSALTKQLSQQMTAIQQQLRALMATRSDVNLPSAAIPAPKTEQKKFVKSGKPATSSPKPGFCFRCGEDGHIKPQCENEPNPTLVSMKRKQLNSKQQKFQKRNYSASKHLN